ncbi:MAG: DUF547 domain-containing protein [Acidobacteria bacterium]|nr:DUF547 domain-containing protein [Acidobacteriota bacterium]
MKSGSRLIPAGWVLLSCLLILVAPGCAPRAVALQGQAALAIRKGIESGNGTFDHSRFSKVLETYSREMGSRFDYEGLKARPEDLNGYLEAVANAGLSGLSRDELLALLINAYNAATLSSILESFDTAHPQGVNSIRDIPEVFTRKTHRIGGYLLSLDNLEHGLIRPLFKDPRAHFVVNCASISCAPLPPQALTGNTLEAQLEYAARRTLSSPDYVRVDGDRLLVTKLMDWFVADFTTQEFHGAEKSLPRYIRKYASEEVAHFLDGAGEDPPLGFMDYDWSLNRATRLPIQDMPL